mgnify:CR=1 FL=1
MDGPCAGAAQMGFEFGESHFDRVEVGAVWWSEEEPCAPGLQYGLGFFTFVAGEIVEDDDIARLEGRGELGFDIGFEGCAVHGAVDDPWRGQSITAQRRDEGLGFPVAKGRSRLEALVTAGPSSQPCHLRRGCRFVDEDQPMRRLAQAGLPINAPVPARLGNIIASALRGQQRFF